MQILQNITVVEVSNGPLAGLTGMVLADFGAKVIWLEYGAAAPGYQIWQRGKQRVAVALPGDADDIADVVNTAADVFLTDLATPTLAAMGLDQGTLRVERPDMVIAQVSGFGEGNPYSHLAANGDRVPVDESLVAAAIGRMNVFEGVADRPGPVFPAVKVGTHGASQAAAAGIVAQLMRRTDSGRGGCVRSSILRALTAYDLVNLGASQIDPSPLPEIDPLTQMPMLNFQPVQCADGKWLQLGNLLPHLQANFLRAAGLEDILDDPEFDQVPYAEDTLERYRERICEQMLTRSSAEWTELFVANAGVASHPYQTTQQAMRDPDLVANGHSVEMDGVLQLGVLGRFAETPGKVGKKPVQEVLRDLKPAPVAPPPLKEQDPSLPLQGVTVVEAAAIIASPLGASMLADLGARVIKIEPLDGDPFREMAFGIGSARCNTDKESIALNLKTPEGQEIAQQLVAKADIFIHNYRIGVPERLGLDYATLAAVNPKLVYLAVVGYGPLGPGAVRPATHPVPGAALGGVMYQFGELPETIVSYAEKKEISRRLFRANEVNPDPNTSFVVATAASLGLYAARVHGIGQRIDLDMFGANAYANFDDFADMGNGSQRPAIDPDHLGLGPYQQLYPCAEGWLYVCLPTARERQIFHEYVPEFSVLKQRTAAQWETLLLADGLGCVQADVDVTGLRIQAEKFLGSELIAEFEHPRHGAGIRHGAMSDWPGIARSLQGPCEIGDYTLDLLAELGHADAEIQRLQENGIVKQYAP